MHMRVGMRLGLGFFTVLLIVGVVFGVFLAQIRDMERKAIQLRDESVPFAITAEQMSGYVNAVQQFLTDASLTGNRGAVQEARDFAKGVRAGLDKFQNMFAAEHNQAEMRRVNDIRKEFEEFLRVGERMVDVYLEQGKMAGDVVMEEFDKGAEKLRNVLEPLRKEQVDQAATSLALVVKTTEMLSRLLWLVGLSVMVVGVVVAVLITRSITVSLNEGVRLITASSVRMLASLAEQERVAAQQAAAVNETNTTMEELAASARQSAEQSDVAANSAEMALELSQFGMSRVEETLANMDKAKGKMEAIAQQISQLSEKSGQIRDIANLVSDFANETKMLAMNAAVEAVRAGEHGKGFAVLAMETRKLADESKRSAGKINALVAEVQRANNSTVMATEEGSKTVDEGMVISQNTAETFREVAQSMGVASQGAQQISLNVRQQSVAIRQVVEAMQSINTGARESAAGMSQVKEGILLLNQAAEALRRMV
ncbi:MAG: methyl-accepting chemotaxis protein [Magnetococcus sp. YQC-3]